MSYHLCDKITWKQSLLLLKHDMYAQRVYTNPWYLTKDVLYLSLPLSGICSLALMIPALMNPLETWWDTICIIVFVPLSFILPLVWICAYFGWYKNIKKINTIMLNLISSLDRVDSIAQYSPVGYTFQYEQQEFQAVFQENQSPGKPVSVAEGKLLLALFYMDPQERDFGTLIEEIAGYLKGKRIGDFAMSTNQLLYRFDSKHLPSPKEAIEALDLMLYLVQRFNLALTSEKGEELSDEEEGEDEDGNEAD